MCKKCDIESVSPAATVELFFLGSEKVKEKRREAPIVEPSCHFLVPFTESTATASMSKDD
jgi:hypothetical protein